MVVWQSRFVNRLFCECVRVGRLYVFSYMCVCVKDTPTEREGGRERDRERLCQCVLLPSLIVFI